MEIYAKTLNPHFYMAETVRNPQILLSLLALVVLCHGREFAADDGHGGEDADEGGSEAEPAVGGHTIDDIADEAAGHDDGHVRHLRAHMIDVMALRTGRGENRRIGNRRGVVARDRTGEDGRDAKHEHVRIARAENRHGNRNKDSESAPGGARGEGQNEITDALLLTTAPTKPPRSRY